MSLVNTKGIDISSNNGDIDLSKVKNAGFNWVMIRTGYGSDIASQVDTQFVNNVAKAEKLGMPWGVYHFSYACSKDDAKSELAHIDRLLKTEKAKGHCPSLPVAIDIEWTEYHEKYGGWNSTNLTNVATIILDGLKNLGYYPMIYTGYDELAMMSNHIRNDFDCWFAQWNTKPNSYKYNRMGIWQYGGETNYLESNSIPGVGTIDKNICYKDYPTIIKNGGYNGWKKNSGSKSYSVKKPIEMLAFEVLNGEWGDGDSRKTNLTNAGYDYNKVQARVNEIVESQSKPTLDKTGYKFKDSNIGILAIKESLIYAKKLGIISQSVNEDKGFGDGTLIAVNQVLKKGGYNQNGIMGENFVKYLSKLIKEKTNK